MAEDFHPPSILSTLGEEIVRILAPVSACMLLVVLLVSTLSSSSPPPIFPISSSGAAATDFLWPDLAGAAIAALVFVVFLTALTFLLVLLFYFRFTRFLRFYMAFSSLVVLALLGAQISLLVIHRFLVPIDAVTFFVILLNFSAVGVFAVFSPRMPIVLTQGYLVIIGVLVAYWFTLLPEWTTWSLLVAMALYDLAAVLLPLGPLRILVELAISRDEEIPALVYEARPVEAPSGAQRRRIWSERRDLGGNPVGSGANLSDRRDFGGNPVAFDANLSERRDLGSNLPISTNANASIPVDLEARMGVAEGGLTTPLIEERSEEDGIGLSSTGAIKLGLGDFIFYSVLVGRAAMYDFMAVYACYLAIIAGLGITLFLLALYRKALPALPVSVLLEGFFFIQSYRSNRTGYLCNLVVMPSFLF